jgi:nucleotide-binding universal stress UspA family protein
MLARLLIPLDGSKMAESVLPATAVLAGKLQATVLLIHVIEKGAPARIHGQAHLSDAAEAEAYLAEVARRAFAPGVPVERHVHAIEVDRVAASIVAHVSELDSDLIAMCTHGHGGARDLFFGSIAQQVIALGKTPVLVFRAGRSADAPAFTGRRMLIPLDGESEHERGLDAIRPLARACGAALHLLTVVPTYGTLSGSQAPGSRTLPGTTRRMLDMAVEDAEQYLHTLAAKLQPEGLEITTSVLRGDAASVIAEAGENLGVDLIAVATHGKSHMDSFWSGSMTPQLIRSCAIPLLLVPVRA